MPAKNDKHCSQQWKAKAFVQLSTPHKEKTVVQPTGPVHGITEGPVIVIGSRTVPTSSTSMYSTTIRTCTSNEIHKMISSGIIRARLLPSTRTVPSAVLGVRCKSEKYCIVSLLLSHFTASDNKPITTTSSIITTPVALCPTTQHHITTRLPRDMTHEGPGGSTRSSQCR